MTSAEWVEWGRAPRGRVWHLLCPFGSPDGDPAAALCSLDHQITESLQGQPPSGARVCSACDRRVAELNRALMAALAQESFVTGEPAAPDEYTNEPVRELALP